jgi:sterol desaturase/sphingolipid hydroxylase (fatty acid hydroxylase superfamily)
VRRTLAVGGGLLLVAVAFIAAAKVADTREGLIAEVVTLMSGLAGVGLLLYGLIPKRPTPAAAGRKRPAEGQNNGPRSANDLLLGILGIVLVVALLTGLVLSAGWLWALLGAVLLLPMTIGCGYLLAAFIRAPQREWRIDLRRLTSIR